ncbi:MAG: dethiobiotin synthase [Acidimicrobiales bacterium]|nr:dethiobiotin synthase [Acidimicrobiales bacterium]
MLVVCAGTATDVGKTWVGAATLAELRRRGHTVSARKPAQSYDPAAAGPLDAAVLAAATGERADDVCLPKRTYPLPMAPPMAAAALGQPEPTLTGLVAELLWPDPPPEVAWVELVGGPRSPMAVDGDGVDLTARLGPDHVVLVADAGLGTINAVALSLEPFVAMGHRPVVLLNRYDPAVDLHRRNWTWLTDRCGAPVVTDAVALADALAPTPR